VQLVHIGIYKSFMMSADTNHLEIIENLKIELLKERKARLALEEECDQLAMANQVYIVFKSCCYFYDDL
jgi:hypothetical protein